MLRMERMTADQAKAGPLERDIHLAITALKKGSQLLKYGRRGKPKFCPFRLSNDESVLTWYSGKDEKYVKLSHVSRIIPGQRTPIFQRYPRPEKEYQSFSLIYDDRSLDLICKDKDEAEVWFTGLKALISRGLQQKGRAETKSGVTSEATSPRSHTQRSSPLSSPFCSGDSSQKDEVEPFHPHATAESPPKVHLEKALSDAMLYALPPKVPFPSDSASGSFQSLSSGGSDGMNGRTKGAGTDAFRVSLSSAVSSSSQGSGHDDGDALGDVFIWGEGVGDCILGGGLHRVGSSSSSKTDSFVPKVLESAVVLDVQSIACGGRHAAFVTKQGEVFSWGEELGGRLGHGVDADISQPKLIEGLKNLNVEFLACGEYHSCAVTLSGDIYTWGGSTSNFALLGHGFQSSQWVPKKLNGPLEGIHVSSVSCGPWHTAVVTSAGQLFTFGDGTFGVLGHGDRKSISVPREVESLKGLRTVRVACGVWHSAAVIEVMVGSSSSSNCSSGKLFTWGDGDKGRLGHGDKDARLVPTCVAALVDPNFCQVACGQSLTVALTTTGHVYTMGSPVFGQLGIPQADGKLPRRVEGKLMKNFVEEIACGAYHVAVLTSRTEVYTWGKGANGRLGLGDTEDKFSPTLVEALRDKQVKSIVCGTNFTAAICLHKWVSGVDQSMCSGCRLPFNFKRKRHNCYNCGLVLCHSCSSKKCLKASMAPNPNKPYRVCDNCFGKLRKASETNSSSGSALKKGSNQGFTELSEKKIKDLDTGSSTRNKKLDFSSNSVAPFPNGISERRAFSGTKSFNPVFGSSKKFFSASLPGSRIASRATSPTSRRSSPPRAKTPTPALSGITLPNVVEYARGTNDGLSEEIIKLRAQVEDLTRKSRVQDTELERTTHQLKEAVKVADEETAKCKAAKEVIKSLTAQLKEMAERLPIGTARSSDTRPLGFSSPTHDVSTTAIEKASSPLTFHEPHSIASNSLVVSNASRILSNHASNPTEVANSEATTRHKNRGTKAETTNGDEWVEQDEPGVYITLVSLPTGVKDLKRVRFSRKRFSEKQAEQWWAANRTRVYQQYNVPVVEKSSIPIGREGLAH
ncbi:putative chromatin regulator PHD family [Rosa chinensis]|uniref:Putative chromatin regulator PHD family n=1 Tax=Rosa chinensis TaxID=74649 RepID=A0A2P6S9K1_ROSCH|nr:PH, RCC1 and FYVE domains-containing protein 1 isoform X1 [Rosa chinensis]PRQ55378.1 putative chromatin regulator PHD family [Rosa chinensis]